MIPGFFQVSLRLHNFKKRYRIFAKDLANSLPLVFGERSRGTMRCSLLLGSFRI